MKKTFTILSLLIICSACMAPIQNLTRTQYSNPEFTAELLKQGGLALFPITAGQGQEGYRRPLGDYLNDNLHLSVKDGQTLTWQNTMEKLNAADKVSIYEDIILSYKSTSILNRSKVVQLKEALGVRYALYVALQDYSETSSTGYNFFTGIETKTTANVQAHCLIVDLDTGDVMQEIIGQASSTAGKYNIGNESYEKFAQVVANSVLIQLPGSEVKPLENK